MSWHCLLCDRHGFGAGPEYLSHWLREHARDDRLRVVR